MPELPEVESVVRGLAPLINNQSIQAIDVYGTGLRTPWPAGLHQTFHNKTILSVTRRAKYILMTFAQDTVLIVHLGMTGAFVVVPDNSLPPHTRARLTFKNGLCLAYTDPRKFGFFDFCTLEQLPLHPKLAGLGPEPFALTGQIFYTLISGRTAPIKPVLMDQNCLVGVGNIYASESLFHAGIHPGQAANSLSKQAATTLLKSVKTVLNQAISAGGSTLRNYKTPAGTVGQFQDNFAVYGRANNPCQTCGKPIVKILQSGRSTFFCPCCQSL